MSDLELHQPPRVKLYINYLDCQPGSSSVTRAWFLFHVACHDSRRQCLDAESKTICYFMPNVSSVNWNTAWKTCKELDATLPVILNKEGQKSFEDYLTEHFDVQPVWTAGRYIGNREWRWLNNQTVKRTDEPKCLQRGHHSDNCTHQTQAVLTKQLEYESRYARNDYNYICSFPAVNCTTGSQILKSTKWKGGCLNWTTNKRLSLNEARNECLKGGGDLATFNDKEDLDRLKRDVSTLQEDADDNGYWIGLHRKWWIWNTTDVDDIKYNLLVDYGDLAGNCLFIDLRSKWSRDKCFVNKTVICQTEIREEISANAHFTASLTIGLVIAVLAVAITVVILLIFIRRLWHVAETNTNAGTSTRKADPTTAPQITIDESQDSTYATIDLDEDVENLNYENGPNPSISYTKVEFCDDPLAVYSEPTDFSTSEPNRSTAVYSDPYINSAVMTPVPQNLVGPSGDIYSEVNEPEQQKKSDELTSPPIKIGPQGDIYTLPISQN